MEMAATRKIFFCTCILHFWEPRICTSALLHFLHFCQELQGGKSALAFCTSDFCTWAAKGLAAAAVDPKKILLLQRQARGTAPNDPKILPLLQRSYGWIFTNILPIAIFTNILPMAEFY